MSSAATSLNDNDIRTQHEMAGQRAKTASVARIAIVSSLADAGEVGNGFAIVASKVKSLANQTAKATQEISGQIGAIQSAEAIRVSTA